MFLHLGADIVVPLRDVIAITDFKSGKSGINKEFLNKMQDEKKMIDISEKNCKSFIITNKTVYLSAISSLTLKKRANSFSMSNSLISI
ncbi:extracellular matrix regulator RemB [Pelosinus sp. sgz500959]|uniref:extracellular matrix regulator RemB n=1 Tax=Pelosinus sp. sgz500959 TaxID=3242472 RepID=UPI0036706B28